jgi:hypothetical protein
MAARSGVARMLRSAFCALSLLSLSTAMAFRASWIGPAKGSVPLALSLQARFRVCSPFRCCHPASFLARIHQRPHFLAMLPPPTHTHTFSLSTSLHSPFSSISGSQHNQNSQMFTSCVECREIKNLVIREHKKLSPMQHPSFSYGFERRLPKEKSDFLRHSRSSGVVLAPTFSKITRSWFVARQS